MCENQLNKNEDSVCCYILNGKIQIVINYESIEKIIGNDVLNKNLCDEYNIIKIIMSCITKAISLAIKPDSNSNNISKYTVLTCKYGNRYISSIKTYDPKKDIHDEIIRITNTFNIIPDYTEINLLTGDFYENEIEEFIKNNKEIITEVEDYTMGVCHGIITLNTNYLYNLK